MPVNTWISLIIQLPQIRRPFAMSLSEGLQGL
jgi:hypothetical protein